MKVTACLVASGDEELSEFSDEAPQPGRKGRPWKIAAMAMVTLLVAVAAVSWTRSDAVGEPYIKDLSTAIQMSVPHAAATFEGGGFRAQSAYTGFLSGMMGATGLGLEDLMQAFSTVSGNSGGTWFLTSLIYSSSYDDMMARMAAEPSQAGAIFNDSFVKPLLKLEPLGSEGIPDSTYETLAFCYYMLMGDLAELQKVPIEKMGTKAAQKAWQTYLGTLGHVAKAAAETKMAVAKSTCKALPEACKRKAKDELKSVLPPRSEMLSEMAHIAKATGIPFIQDFVLWLGFMEAGGSSWESMVAEVLKKTAGITLDVTLDAAPMTWANGKIWHACFSIPTPQKEDSEDGIGQNVWVVQDPMAPLSKFIRYNVTTTEASIGSDYEIYTPGKFTYLLGSGQKKMPLPICGDDECFGFQHHYFGNVEDDSFTATSPTLGKLFHEAFTDGAHLLPVARIAASSSAAFGGADLFAVSASMMSGQCYNLASWTSGAPDGKSYDVATKAKEDALKTGITQSAVDKLALSGTGAFIDGGFTDNLGLAWAISSGATVATVLMNGATINNLWQLFGHPSQGNAPMRQVSFKIFSTSYQDAEKEWDTFPSLAVPSSSKYLHGIQYGTIQTTTQANKWFNISAGIPITLKLILVNVTDVSDALFTNYYIYADFVGEVVTSLTSPDNEPAVQEILQDYFMRRPKTADNSE